MHMYRMQLNWAMLIHRRDLTKNLEKRLKNLNSNEQKNKKKQKSRY